MSSRKRKRLSDTMDDAPSSQSSTDKDSGEDHFSSNSISTIPDTPDDISRWQCHIDLQDFGERLQAAAEAVFPNTADSRYSKVSVLMLCWEDEDPRLPVSLEISKLGDIFRNLYRFETEIWKIPDQNCHAKLNQKILDLVSVEGNSTEHLFIVYYAGHAYLNKSRLPAWTSWRNNLDQTARPPTVQWSGIQNVLEHSDSDVLILLDCFNSGTANASEGSGVTELISACDFNSIANAVGNHSFTTELVNELQGLCSKASFTVAELYRNIFCRIQGRQPEKGRWHPAPIHLSLTQDSIRLPRSIQLSPLRQNLSDSKTSKSSLLGFVERSFTGNTKSKMRITANSRAKADKNETAEGNDLTDHCHSTVEESELQTSLALTTSTLVPRILLSIRLSDNLSTKELSDDLFKEWLRRLPIIAQEVKVEAGFGRYSSILIVSMPFILSMYLPDDPAIIKLGAVSTPNILAVTNMEGDTKLGYTASIEPAKWQKLSPLSAPQSHRSSIQVDHHAINNDQPKVRKQTPIVTESFASKMAAPSDLAKGPKSISSRRARLDYFYTWVCHCCQEDCGTTVNNPRCPNIDCQHLQCENCMRSYHKVHER